MTNTVNTPATVNNQLVLRDTPVGVTVKTRIRGGLKIKLDS